MSYYSRGTWINCRKCGELYFSEFLMTDRMLELCPECKKQEFKYSNNTKNEKTI